MRVKELSDKDMSVTREMPPTLSQAKQTNAVLKDYTLQHRVSIQWDLNEDSIKEKMFLLKIDDKEVILDSEEMFRYLRWV